jgi:predicted lactoylglutathione lyase
MTKMIFVNLPVADVAKATAFYEAIGLTKNAQFSNEQASMMVWSDTIAFMLLARPFYSTFTSKQIADAHAVSETLLCLSCDSREAVDAIVAKATAAGGKADPGPKQDMGFMYGRSFEDLDGHHFEPMWMDVAAATASDDLHQPIVA